MSQTTVFVIRCISWQRVDGKWAEPHNNHWHEVTAFFSRLCLFSLNFINPAHYIIKTSTSLYPLTTHNICFTLNTLLIFCMQCLSSKFSSLYSVIVIFIPLWPTDHSLHWLFDFTITSPGFYPCDAMLARVIAIATCLSVRPSHAGIVSKWRKLAAWFLHRLVAPRL